MERSVLLLGTARERSTRLPRKMTRPFADTTLFDIYMSKLEKLRSIGLFDEIAVALWEGDTILCNQARAYDVPIVGRSKESVTGLRARKDELHFLDSFTSDYVLWLNGCLPFLSIDTVVDAVRVFDGNPQIKSMTPVVREHNWFWWKRGEPINNTDPMCVSTQGCPPVMRSVHAFHIFNRQVMLEHSCYWEFSSVGLDPFLYVVDDTVEFLDIDTQLDFGVCETIWHSSEDCNKN